MLKLRKRFQYWRERRENEKIQRVISKKYDREAIPMPDTLDLSADSIYLFAYIHYKAFSFLYVGPKVYRKQDYFNLPPEDWDASRIEIVRNGCEQINQWRGLTFETPLVDLEVQGFYDLLHLFHFRLIKQTARSDRPDTFLDKMLMEHIVNKKQITLFNRVKKKKIFFNYDYN